MIYNEDLHNFFQSFFNISAAAVLRLEDFVNHMQYAFVCREPADGEQGVFGEPGGGFVLVEVEGFAGWCAAEAVHCEMEVGIVPLDGVNEVSDGDFGVEFLADFAHERLLRAFPGLHFPAREFPPVFELSVPPLGRKYFISASYHRGHDLDVFHNDSSVIYSYRLLSTGVWSLYPIFTAVILSVPGIVNSSE